MQGECRNYFLYLILNFPDLPHFLDLFRILSLYAFLAKASLSFFLVLVFSVIYSLSDLLAISSNNQSILSDSISVVFEKNQSDCWIVHLYLSPSL
jgi:hypothetical protein